MVAANAARLLIEGDQLACESPERHVQLTETAKPVDRAADVGPAQADRALRAVPVAPA
jgi:hypothetical protein